MPEWVDLVLKTYGPALGLIVAGIVVVVKALWPLYVKRTDEVIANYQAQLAAQQKSAEDVIGSYRAQLAQANAELQAATAERKELTQKFLEALGEQVTKNSAVMEQMVNELRGLKIEVATLRDIVTGRNVKGKSKSEANE